MREISTTARLLAATAICLTASVPSYAGDYGLQSTDATPISNPAGTTIQGDRTGVYSTGSALNLDNAGTIRGDGPNLTVNDSDGGVIISGGPAQITNSGDISGARAGIATMYFNNNGVFEGRAIGSTVANSGSIIGDFGPGVRLIGGGSVTNSGYIAGRVGAGADGIAIFAYNGQDTTGMTGIGSVTNLAGGLIEGNRTGVFIIGGGTIDNAGSIDHGARIIGTGPGQTGAITNSGTIFNGGIEMSSLASADVANSGHTVVIGLAGVGTVNVTNSGTVDYFTSFDTVGTADVNNSGSIGEGLIFNHTTTANVTNSGSIIATDTPDVVGTTQDALFSDAALTLTNTAAGTIDGFVSGIRSNGASLTLDNAGTIRGNGDEAFSANSAGGVVLRGGPGYITNSGLISGQQFGITTIYVTTDPFLGLAIGSTINNSGTIIGDNNDGIRLIGGGTVTNSGYIAGRVGAVADGISMFAYEDQDLNSFDVIGSVTNLAGGVIEGNRFGVIMSNGGIVDNAGTISGNSGSVLLQAREDGHDLPRNGTVTNSGTLNGTVQFNNLASASVTNSGTIQSPNGNGVYTTAPGGPLSVTNLSTGSITGSVSGIRTDGTSLTLNNAGIIRGNGNQAFSGNSAGGVVLQGGPGFITNSGLISGQQFGITTIYVTTDPFLGLAIGSTVDNSGSIIGDNNDGVRLIGGGTVTNSGYIAGRLGAGADGVSMFSFEGQDLTSFNVIGSVTNLTGGVIEGNRFGVIMSNGGIVDNAGTISGNSGSILLQAQAVGSELPRNGTVTNSGTLNGTVQFNNLASASVANSGTIASPTGNGIFTTAPGGSLSVDNQVGGSITGAINGIRSDGSSMSLNNAGIIFGLGTADDIEIDANGGVILSGGPASITNSGSIFGAKFGIATVYFTNPDSSITGLTTDTTVTNSGSIVGEGNDGIRLHGGGTVTNSGYIAGRVRVGADGVSILAFDGQDLSGLGSAGIGTVNNLLGGVIEGHREGIIISDGGTVNNAGEINGGYRGAIVLEARDAGRIGTLTNSGTINGVVDFIQVASASLANSGAILAPAGAAVHSWAFDGYMGPLAVTNDATGTIIGGTSGIFSEDASLSLTNAGTIRGNGASGTLRVADAGILITGGPAAITNSGNISGAGFGITTGVYSDFFTNAASNRAIGSTIINSGSIIGDSNDGVRLIGGGTVTNSGLISGRVGAVADGVSAYAFDGQDISGSTIIGSVTNLLGGTIDGHRFGVVLSGGGAISNAGTITGGSGAILIQTGSGEAGRTGSISNSGTINGGITFNDLATASVSNSGAINGNVNLNNIASVTVNNSGSLKSLLGGQSHLSITNSGTILFVGATSSSLLNTGTISAGVNGSGWSIDNRGSIAGTSLAFLGSGSIVNTGTISGETAIDMLDLGSINNKLGGVITSQGAAVLMRNGGAVTNAGTITGDLFIGNGTSNSLVNSGTLNGNAEIASLGAASLVNSGLITGDVFIDGNTNVTVTLQTGSKINGTTWAGDTVIDALRLSGTLGAPTPLQSIGHFEKFETLNVLGGYWTAPGNTGTFTSTTINGGALAVNGTLRSPVTVNAGAMLAGTGTITGAVTMNSGGLVAPGGSTIGTLSITGNVAFNAGSTLSVQTNPNGTSDKLAITGAVTITKGSTLQVLAGIFNYAPTTSYVVVNASGGISGKFDTVTTDYAYFKATVNTQQKGTITVQIAPNGKPLPSAATATTFSTASAVESLGTSSPLYQAVLYQSLTGARQAFSSLSGGAYGRLDALTANDVGRVQLRFDPSTTAANLEWSGASSIAARGFNSGSSLRRGPVSLMMVGGRYATRLASEGISADVDTRFLASAAGYRSGRFQALASVTSAWHEVAVSRTVSFPGFADHTSSRYAAQSRRVDLEGSYALVQTGTFSVAPYGGYSRLMMRSQAFQESGGISALTFGRDSRAIDQLRIGARARGDFALGSLTLSPRADVSLNRSWGDLDATRQARFATGRDDFDSVGSGFERQTFAVDAGVDLKAGPVTLSGSYRGRLGNRWRDHSALLSAALRF